MASLQVLLVILSISILCAAITRYEPSWDSLDSRPLPKWYDKAKIGIFIHWGVYSVPAFGSEWFWYFWKKGKTSYVRFMRENYLPGFTYQDFAPQFTAEFFNPEEWARVFDASGARYVVLTSKHHEGYTLWPSANSWNWNSQDVGPERDLVGELANAVRSVAPHIRFGLYYSLYEWFNPLYRNDKENRFQTNEFVVSKTFPELYDIVKTYKPEVIWSDGDDEAHDWYWNSTVFLAWLFNDSPVKETVVVNDRWGMETSCKHGSYYTCSDRYNPGVLQSYKWENCMTLDRKSWGYRRNAAVQDYLSIHELITQVAETVSCGGNILINIGPTHDGRLPPIMEERLRQLGSWLDINGDAIYGSRPWTYQKDTDTPGVWYTTDEGLHLTYAIVLHWPKRNTLFLGAVRATERTKVSLLGCDEGLDTGLQFKSERDGLTIPFPNMADVTSQWAWVLVMSGVNPSLPNCRPAVPGHECHP